MAALLDQLRIWIESVISALGYPGIVFIMALENVFPPIPSELVMPFAGFLVACKGQDISQACANSEFTLLGVTLAGMLGSVLGALVLYYVGYFANEVIIRRFVRRFGRWFLLSEEDLDVALGYFSRYGELVVFFGRLIPLIRSLISIPAGMQRMPLPRFLLFSVLGTTVWSGILATGGYLLGANWERVMHFVESYQDVVLILLVLAVLGFLYWKLIHPRLAKNNAPQI